LSFRPDRAAPPKGGAECKTARARDAWVKVRRMMRLAWPMLVALAACGTTDDDRPVTLQYITESILQPSCGAAECHSAFARQKGYAFDTVENARESFQFDTDLVISPHENDNLHSDGSLTLINNLTIAQTNASRMPYDAPLPNADIDLIERWLKANGPGMCPSGATSICRSARATSICGNEGQPKCTVAVPCKTGNDSFDYSTYDLNPPDLSLMYVCANGCSNGACL
jgi:hypothetical protein